MEALIQLGLFATLLGLGFFFGRRAEAKHYQSIFAREDELRQIVVSTDRFPPIEFMNHNAALVSGNVVISVDYFKRVSAGLRALVGGRIRSYETLLDRARREALLRMQEQARRTGAEAIINTKFETSRVSGNNNKGIGSIEVLAYGTALSPKAIPPKALETSAITL
ncbi:YbjQ family protein [uncultured Zhongshania sp.]|uniref:YbjQ family protein n=1 Tax=uncultured Zhongshania sp. TaxID=1642288 RepID=UPI0025D6591D|nr:YbjQ family protein [uncultured Zhongshania sp.]